LDPKLRIVTSIPLAELWTDAGPLAAQRIRYLASDDLHGLLRQGPLRFVLADCGKPLRWIEHSACYDFWKEEVKPRLASPDTFSPEDYPDGHCYLASEWATDDGESAILVEAYH